MPVTTTAKRALRGSLRKQKINSRAAKELEVALRIAKNKKTQAAVNNASAIADRAAKINLIHKNKAARLKSRLAKLLPKKKAKPTKKSS